MGREIEHEHFGIAPIAQCDPRLAFDQLFGSGGTPEKRAARRKAQKSILDWIPDEVERLKRRLGPEDQARYEAQQKKYKDRIAPIEMEIAAIEKPWRERVIERKRAALEPKFRAALETPKEERNAEQQELAKNAEKQTKPSWDEVVNEIPADLREKRAAFRRKLHELEWTMPEPVRAAFAVVAEATSLTVTPRSSATFAAASTT